jgi:hypothetical protein
MVALLARPPPRLYRPAARGAREALCRWPCRREINRARRQAGAVSRCARNRHQRRASRAHDECRAAPARHRSFRFEFLFAGMRCAALAKGNQCSYVVPGVGPNALPSEESFLRNDVHGGRRVGRRRAADALLDSPTIPSGRSSTTSPLVLSGGHIRCRSTPRGATSTASRISSRARSIPSSSPAGKGTCAQSRSACAAKPERPRHPRRGGTAERVKLDSPPGDGRRAGSASFPTRRRSPRRRSSDG